MCRFASDTPLAGPTYQDVHRDTPELFDGETETPSFPFAVNFPPCDVTCSAMCSRHQARAPDACEIHAAGRRCGHACRRRELTEVCVPASVQPGRSSAGCTFCVDLPGASHLLAAHRATPGSANIPETA